METHFIQQELHINEKYDYFGSLYFTAKLMKSVCVGGGGGGGVTKTTPHGKSCSSLITSYACIRQ